MRRYSIKNGKINIDDKEIEFLEGETILEAANRANIYIPRLCYIEGLAPYGGCRLCIVKVKGIRGFTTACTTPAIDGMKIKNNEQEVQYYRKEIFKLLLSEHPHACIVCQNKNNCEELRINIDKFGRTLGCFTCASKDTCSLRKIAEYLGIYDVPYNLEYHNYPLKREDPFFEKDYNLCILCGKCVRVCDELRGIGAINFINRGHHTKISTEFDHLSIDSSCQFCGSCVDICPTGALSSKNTKWKLNDLDSNPSICGFCNVGCSFDYFSNNSIVMDSIPNNKNNINRGHGCVIGRFCTSQFNNGKDRLKYPCIKERGELIPTDWNTAYFQIKEKLKNYKSEEIAIIASPNLSNESAFILNKFVREILKTDNISIGSDNNSIDLYYRLVKKTFNINYIPRSYQNIEQAKLILLINTNVQVSHAILYNYIIKAKRNGAKVISLSTDNTILSKITKQAIDYELDFSFEELIQFLIQLSKKYVQIVKNINNNSPNREKFANFMDNFDYTEKNPEYIKAIEEIFKIISRKENNKATIIIDLDYNYSDYNLENLVGNIFNLLKIAKNKITHIPLFHDGNKEGVYQNISYNQPLKSKEDIITKIKDNKIRALYLTERFNDLEILKNVDYIILQDIYFSDNYEKADVILPTSTFLEDSGSFLNAQLDIQKFQKSVEKIGNSKSDWLIFSELAKIIDENKKNQFIYNNFEEIFEEIKSVNPFYNQTIQEDIHKDQDFYIPDLNKPFSENQIKPFSLSSFKYRGEAIFNQVGDLKKLIDYRKLRKLDNEIDIITEKDKEIETPFKVLSNLEITPNTYELIVKAPLIAKQAKPGNFVILMKDDKSERIPLTITDWDTDNGLIIIYYQEKGLSTRELTYLKKGNFIFSIVGPLGKDYPIEKYGTVLLGGGCFGNAAIYPIARALKKAGNRVIILIEGKNQMDFYLEKKFRAISDEIIYCTSDGTKGLKGKVDVGIEYILKKEQKIDRCHFIGCNYMMMEASNTTKKHGDIPTTVSLSTIMIDGTGMCGCCRLTILENEKEIIKFACVDGPIFNGHQVKWDELIYRCNQYDLSEKQIYQKHSCKLDVLIEEKKKNE